VRRFLRRRHRPLIAVVMLGLTVNAWVQAGTFAVLVVLIAGAAVLAIVALEFLLTGASAAHHSMQMEQAIKAIKASRRKQVEAARRKELTR
jgi:type IV secretory pathway VirB3-like protein